MELDDLSLDIIIRDKSVNYGNIWNQSVFNYLTSIDLIVNHSVSNDLLSIALMRDYSSTLDYRRIKFPNKETKMEFLLRWT